VDVPIWIGAELLRRTQEQPAVKPATVIIKKYGNRRLYDTSGSRYVNLDDLAALVREGKEVRVEDAKTGKDLTRVTLTQIITEDAKQKPTGLPLELLRELIVASDQARQEFIMWYLKSAFDTYQAVQSAVQDRIGNMQSALLSPMESMKRFLGGVSGPQPAEDKEELSTLRRRVAQLEARLQKPPRRKRRAAPKPRAGTRTPPARGAAEPSPSNS
jgi:polyhydroxyalkanoate synthesis repressor PhaR